MNAPKTESLAERVYREIREAAEELRAEQDRVSGPAPSVNELEEGYPCRVVVVPNGLRNGLHAVQVATFVRREKKSGEMLRMLKSDECWFLAPDWSVVPYPESLAGDWKS